MENEYYFHIGITPIICVKLNFSDTTKIYFIYIFSNLQTTLKFEILFYQDVNISRTVCTIIIDVFEIINMHPKFDSNSTNTTSEERINV